jgi:signal transduction histidine kinase
MVEDRVIGVLSSQSFKKNAYTQYHFDILNNLAAYAAIALDNANAYEEIKKANKELKDAQTQLIQSEKLASLGQLTAGIAHEIKNPLNFVNNFSVLSVELIDEFRLIFGKESGKIDPKTSQDIEDIISDLESNVKKIEEHGKRADSIVRGMLLHSRGKAGEMQPTDINILVAEYVNLGYHGMRAQDSTFNLKIETDFDNSIGMVRVVPQDISRVFLNIINNACYSTNTKKKELKDAYVPVLSIKTKSHEDRIEIIIRDNGKGIPQDIIDKVFNPFFTTKPAGSGTGLGLSISYDIIAQEHKGELKFDTKEGEFAEFTISIPRNL